MNNDERRRVAVCIIEQLCKDPKCNIEDILGILAYASLHVTLSFVDCLQEARSRIQKEEPK